jgi:hypothetical protein
VGNFRIATSVFTLNYSGTSKLKISIKIALKLSSFGICSFWQLHTTGKMKKYFIFIGIILGSFLCFKIFQFLKHTNNQPSEAFKQRAKDNNAFY